MFWPARMSKIMPPRQETIFTRPGEGRDAQNLEAGIARGAEATIAAADPFDPSPIIQKALLSSKARDEKEGVGVSGSSSRSCLDLDGSYPSLDSVVSISSSAASTPQYRGEPMSGSPLRTYGSRKRKDSSASAADSTPAKLAALQPTPLPPPVVAVPQVPAPSGVPLRYPVPAMLPGPAPPVSRPVRLVLVPARPSVIMANHSRGATIGSPIRLVPPTVFRPNQDFSQRLLLRPPIAGSAALVPGGRPQLVPVPVVPHPPNQQQREIIHVFSLPVSTAGVVHPPQAAAQVRRIELSTQNPLTRQLGHMSSNQSYPNC
jgi:hypothetical protein